MIRLKCLTCKKILNQDQRQRHIQLHNHTRFIEISGELSITQRWAVELENDEMEGMKTMKIKLGTFDLIKQISTKIEAATFDIVITKAVEALLREQQNKSYEFGTEEET
jgi:hypothetical protein